jgi:hypothetical protein
MSEHFIRLRRELAIDEHDIDRVVDKVAFEEEDRKLIIIILCINPKGFVEFIRNIFDDYR